MTIIKERPILFSGPMVRAILDGRKTQTRRIMKIQPVQAPGYFGGYALECKDSRSPISIGAINSGSCLDICPYGKPCDQLWVRETWQGFRQVNYEYDEWEEMESPKDRHNYVFSPVFQANNENFPDKWFPSIHMPREFSRIDLRITGVRVERLHDMRVNDYEAEGIVDQPMDIDTALDKWRTLWNTLNGAGSWQKNPWVWVVEFERLKP